MYAEGRWNWWIIFSSLNNLQNITLIFSNMYRSSVKFRLSWRRNWANFIYKGGEVDQNPCISHDSISLSRTKRVWTPNFESKTSYNEVLKPAENEISVQHPWIRSDVSTRRADSTTASSRRSWRGGTSAISQLVLFANPISRRSNPIPTATFRKKNLILACTSFFASYPQNYGFWIGPNKDQEIWEDFQSSSERWYDPFTLH